MGRRQASPVNPTPKYLVPKNTAAVLSASASKCQHLGLFLGRYTPQQAIAKENWDHRGRVKWHDQWLKQDVLPRFDTSAEALRGLQMAVYARWREATARAETFQARSKSRLIIGLGGKGVLEVGITLHYVTGLPVIPGSALKGLARTYALLTIAEKVRIPILNPEQLQQLQPDKLSSPLEILDAALVAADEQRREALVPLVKTLAKLNRPIDDQIVDSLDKALGKLPQAQHYRAAFGSQEDSGECVFYDAVIAALPNGHLFELDVMTPHFKAYYDDVNSGQPKFDEAPDDAQSPNPIAFITVAAGTTFAFAVGPRRGSDPQVVEQAVRWLKQALAELGVGAKTAAGYGVFEVIRQA